MDDFPTCSRIPIEYPMWCLTRYNADKRKVEFASIPKSEGCVLALFSTARLAAGFGGELAGFQGYHTHQIDNRLDLTVLLELFAWKGCEHIAISYPAGFKLTRVDRLMRETNEPQAVE